jgi:hypothetical protein
MVSAAVSFNLDSSNGNDLLKDILSELLANE